jgi:two-component system response regulator MprA
MNDVLVVDDAADVRALVAALLAVEGIPHRTARHGGEALACIQEAPPAVVLLDIDMPVMNGPAFCQRLHAQGARDDIAIVVMTARAQAAAYERQCAADARLPKPFDLDQLLATVTRFLHEAQDDPTAPVPDSPGA